VKNTEDELRDRLQSFVGMKNTGTTHHLIKRTTEVLLEERGVVTDENVVESSQDEENENE